MTKARITASIIIAVLVGVLVSSASIPFHDVSLRGLKPITQHSVSVPTVSPDITIASCDVTHVPAFTRTDVCIASDGSIAGVH